MTISASVIIYYKDVKNALIIIIIIIIIIIAQDNKSTLAMISNGRSTGPTSRHINIRFFWLNDRFASGEISMRYIPTADMTADLLTKHMEGSSFYKHRNTMLNIN